MVWKLTWREIRHSLGRYLAILAIVALGAGFFTGLRLTKTAMVATLDQYAADTNFYDYRLLSTLGMTGEDVAAAQALPEVAQAEGVNSLDLLCATQRSDELVLKCYSLPQTVNCPTLVAGRMPSAPGECLADANYFAGLLDTTIRVLPGNDADSLDALSRTEYTVVGLVNSPLYLNFERGSTTVGGGKISAFFYVLPECFTVDYYTEIDLTLADKSGGVYSQAYEDSVDAARDALEDFCAARGQLRYESLRADAQQQVDDAKTELSDGQTAYDDGVQELAEQRQQAETQLADARAQLEQADAQLAASQRELDANRQTLRQAQAQLDAGYAQLEQGQTQLDDRRNQTLTPLYAKHDELKAQLDQVQAAIDQLEQLLSQYAQAADGAEQIPADPATAPEAPVAQPDLAQLQEQLQQLQASRDELQQGLAQLEAGIAQAEAEFDAAQAQLEETRAQLDASQTELQQGLAQLEAGSAQLNAARQQAQQGWQDYETARTDAEAQLADAETQLADAKAQLDDGQTRLADAEAELADFQSPDTYALDRMTNVGYVCFENDSDIVRDVAQVFPVFFFLVAALICITTMTRMVDEQRTQIGVLKALGYGKGAIMGRFLLYSGSASVLGCVVGVAICAHLLPAVIWHAYSMLYDFSSIVFAFDWPLVLTASACFVACALLATWYTCSRELSEVPAELIRPKAPKAGKRVLLERVGFVWRRLPFLHKVSIRNVVRYKRRMVMMVLGIGGCTALLLTAFGLQDSVKNVVEYQYDEITLYDAAVSFTQDMDPAAQAQFLAETDGQIADCRFVHESTMDAAAGGAVKNCYVVVPQDDSLAGFVDLHDGDTPLAYPGDGEAIVNRKLANDLSLAVGDTLELRSGDTTAMTLRVSGICDNYIYNYVYITQATYAQAFGTAAPLKTAYVRLADGQNADAAGSVLAAADGVNNVSLTQDLRQRVDKMMTSMDSVIAVVMLCAAVLAAIVLYNLTNINITERIREIATIKVLGFFDGETADYVFRENLLLTVAGALVGLPLGIWLHRFVMYNIQIDMIYFQARILPVSYVLSFVMTIVFAVVVCLLMRFKLNRIHMAEALKSIE